MRKLTIEKLSQDRDVVVEQTFYKAKRRIAYIDAIYEVTDGEVILRIEPPRPEIVERARDKLKQDAFDSEWDYPPNIGYSGGVGNMAQD